MLRVAAIAVLAGCSSILGIEDLGGPSPPDGGMPGNDTPLPGQVRIAGSTLLLEKVDAPPTLLPNAQLELVTGDQTVMATSSGMATYQLAVAASRIGEAFVRFLPIPGVEETANYLPQVSDDFGMDLVTFTSEYMLEIGQLSGESQDPARGFLQIRVVDELGRPQSGVQFNTTFANRVSYADDFGRPGPVVFSSTTSSGLAWVLNVPPGMHAIEATRNSQPLGQRAFDNISGGQISNTHVTFVVPGMP